MKKTFRNSLFIFLGAFVLLLIAYPNWNDNIGITFSFSGEIIRTITFIEAITILVFFFIGHALIYFASVNIGAIDKQDKHWYQLTFMIMPLGAVFISLVILLQILVPGLNVASFGSFAVGLGLVVLGNYIPKVKRNHIFGVRTTKTLSDDEAWLKANRFGGRAIFLAGIICMLTAYINPLIGLIFIFAMLITTFIYTNKI